MPAMRPCSAISRTADRPISAPPNSDCRGVNSVMVFSSGCAKYQSLRCLVRPSEAVVEQMRSAAKRPLRECTCSATVHARCIRRLRSLSRSERSAEEPADQPSHGVRLLDARYVPGIGNDRGIRRCGSGSAIERTSSGGVEPSCSPTMHERRHRQRARRFRQVGVAHRGAGADIAVDRACAGTSCDSRHSRHCPACGRRA